MLILTRKLGEKIWIGDNICVIVTEIDLGKIKLGVVAPRDVEVMREELLMINDPRLDVPLSQDDRPSR